MYDNKRKGETKWLSKAVTLRPCEIADVHDDVEDDLDAFAEGASGGSGARAAGSVTLEASATAAAA